MITLDTLALVCWLGRQKALSQAAHDAIDRELAGGEILISAISAFEIAEFVKVGSLGLSMDARSWMSTFLSLDGVRMIPVDTEIAFRAATLPPTLALHQRLIVATARTHGGALVTSDAKVRASTYVETIW
ncbi:PIN domain nuclease of toxin-antitoxin system [Paraburkholderia sp. Clong3]|uniref:PIN domain nuclease, a component of toxin-antitoxin system (PIN domain) n=1 Tax=Paraburkholderia tuberum TaxID=157910 RepID=A0A1H1K9H6_9BURK|nr:MULTISPECIES: type II toxin-antitoxin system VapC family toxin [Paraburkholderia]MBB5410041.1 PIN domain nuclease of toxin-antitoxin system [Paraburkholderia sp. HC6.4b]MBB5452044.1 PIN domain nuclease of toxin-antitoxin system [Paraburkholderia sp. Kb1A]MBB5466949.1 PIN domain nuclease of toxin-antitoxin system [Paraburkholderia sp. CI2]MBC8724969.1 type II toxin-antitoxin system VapC family toxin [Paraburkholderia sp. 31.1]MBC8728700.1 type II toxin-antitoxin system VapC family toxin [Par